MNDKLMIEMLNEVLKREHACAIRYATHAAVVEGPYAETVKARLKEIADDENRHAEILRDRIFALGETPTMAVRTQDLKPARELSEILKINIEEEKEAIHDYQVILKSVPQDNAILYEAVQDLIKEEQEHLEELEALQPHTAESRI